MARLSSAREEESSAIDAATLTIVSLGHLE